MKFNESLLKPITEVNYLRADNVERYRTIIRYFYLEYEKSHYYVHREDVYKTLIDINYLAGYTKEECQNDLDQLTNWGNLVAQQDSTKVTTLEEFKNRKYRYQLSNYTIEIERMTLRLENLEIEGASLEPTLLERIHNQLLKINQIILKSDSEVGVWWNDLNNDFIRLNRNYQDYIRTLNSAHAEELMKTEAFLIFKEKIIQYLRNFVKGLQEQAMVLEKFIQEINPQIIETLMHKVVAYEFSIPRIDRTFNEESYYETCFGRWQSLYNWFVGEENSEVHQISNNTMDIIRRITRAAQQIGEQLNLGANRKEEYRHIAKIFGQCQTINEAHNMSAMVFGVANCFHLKELDTRVTDDINSGVYDEEATHYLLEARTRKIQAKKSRKPAIDYALEREIQRQEQLSKLEAEQALLKSYIIDNVIDFALLDEVHPQARKILLNWLSRAMSNSYHRARSEWGTHYTVDDTNKELVKIHCEDGDLYIRAFKISFEEDDQ